MYDIEIITVHYKTPDYIYEQYQSIRGLLPSVPYRIIDGSDDGIRYFEELEATDPNVLVDRLGYNIHHGPGMDYAIKGSKHKFLLILDSDVTLKEDPIPYMMSKFSGYAVGKMKMMNAMGMEQWQLGVVGKMLKAFFKYRYIHPYCMLISREAYLQHLPFIKHGSPCIDASIDIYRKKMQHQLTAVSIETFVHLKFKGTRGRWGLNIPRITNLLPRTFFIK